MACDISLGRLEPCKSVGGLKALYFINYDNNFLADITLDANEIITATALTSAYKYELRGANNFDEANEVSKENGTSFWTSTGTIALKVQNAVTRKQMKLMSYGRPIVIAEGYDGQLKIYGIENGCDVAVNTVSGSSMGDLNGYNITITSQEKEPAYFVDSAVLVTDLTVVEGV